MTERVESTPGSPHRVRLFGRGNSAKAFEIRDFLNRSVVEYEWVELDSDEAARRAGGIASLQDPRLPVCELPDGTRLFSPSVRDVAELWCANTRGVQISFRCHGDQATSGDSEYS
jgi:thioredoxin reductase (NADPH)